MKYKVGYIHGDWTLIRKQGVGFRFKCSCGSGIEPYMGMNTMSNYPDGKKCDCIHRKPDGYLKKLHNSKYIGVRFGLMVCKGTLRSRYYFDCDCGRTNIVKDLSTAQVTGHCGCRKGENNIRTIPKHIKGEHEIFIREIKAEEEIEQKSKIVSCENCVWEPTYEQELRGEICLNAKYAEDKWGNCISKVNKKSTWCTDKAKQIKS